MLKHTLPLTKRMPTEILELPYCIGCAVASLTPASLVMTVLRATVQYRYTVYRYHLLEVVGLAL
jgi:hypothetical protein